jgi:quercetin dioxygenase-like cupin family protein
VIHHVPSPSSPVHSPPIHLVTDDERAPLDTTHRSSRRYPALVEPDRPTPAHLARIAQVLSTRMDLWRPLLHIDASRRWNTRVAGGRNWEAWLQTWAPGQSTGLHDHGPSLGAIVVLAGEIHELTRTPDGKRAMRLSRRTLTTSEVVSFRAGHVHAIEGTGTHPAASLHVYTPIISTSTRHDFDHGRGLRATGTDCAGVAW